MSPTHGVTPNAIPFVKLGLNWRNESPESKSLAGDGTEIGTWSG